MGHKGWSSPFFKKWRPHYMRFSRVRITFIPKDSVSYRERGCIMIALKSFQFCPSLVSCEGQVFCNLQIFRMLVMTTCCLLYLSCPTLQHPVFFCFCFQRAGEAHCSWKGIQISGLRSMPHSKVLHLHRKAPLSRVFQLLAGTDFRTNFYCCFPSSRMYRILSVFQALIAQCQKKSSHFLYGNKE